MKNHFISLLPAFLLLFLITHSCEIQGQQTGKYAIKEINNLPYYEDAALQSDLTQLNLLLPKGVKNPPILLWIGQGAWAYVNRHQEMGICRKFAEQGIAVASVGHRLSPALLGRTKNYEGVKHPEHTKDIAQAIKWIYEHAEEYGYSQENIIVGGYSSGAHLAALVAMDGRYLRNLGLSPDVIKAVIPVAGGFDIPHYREAMIIEDPTLEENHINVVFGTTHEEHVHASPTTYIDSLKAAMLMISENYTYPFHKILEEQLAERKYPKFETLNFHDESHASLWTKMGKEEDNLCRKYIVEYIWKICEQSAD